MNKPSIYLSIVILVFPILYSLPVYGRESTLDHCIEIGRTLSSNSKYLCSGKVYYGDGKRYICFSTGKILDLKSGRVPKGCPPVVRQNTCKFADKECKNTRGKSTQFEITSDIAFIEKSPTFSWLEGPNTYYKLVLVDQNRRTIWHKYVRKNSIKFDSQLSPGWYELYIYSLRADGHVLEYTSGLVNILSPEEIQQLEQSTSIISGLDIDPKEKISDLDLIYSSMGLSRSSRMYLLSKNQLFTQ